MFAYKIDVSNGMSDIAQFKALELGYCWEFDQIALGDKTKPHHLKFSYLYLNKNGTIHVSEDTKYFRTEREHKLITVAEFLDFEKKKSKNSLIF